MEDFFNEKVLNEAGCSDLGGALAQRDNIIDHLSTAFDNMQAAPGRAGVQEELGNETYSHKNNVMKTCRKVCNKILSSENTSPELVKKFFAESVIGKTIDQTYKTPRRPVIVTNPENVAGAGGTLQEYYTGDDTNLIDASRSLRDNAVANRALKDDEFRKRLDEEIKAKHQSAPGYFTTDLNIPQHNAFGNAHQ